MRRPSPRVVTFLIEVAVVGVWILTLALVMSVLGSDSAGPGPLMWIGR